MTARDLAGLGLLSRGLLKRVAVWFEQRLARADSRSGLRCVAHVLRLYRDAAPLRPRPALLASIGARLSAALATDEAATGESASKWLVPISPVALLIYYLPGPVCARAQRCQCLLSGRWRVLLWPAQMRQAKLGSAGSLARCILWPAWLRQRPLLCLRQTARARWLGCGLMLAGGRAW